MEDIPKFIKEQAAEIHPEGSPEYWALVIRLMNRAIEVLSEPLEALKP